MSSNHLDERGVWVKIYRPKGGPVEGWLMGEIPQGLVVALDEDLTDIHLIPKYDSISYDNNKKLSKLSFEDTQQVREELQSLSDAISTPMNGAISKINFTRLHQFGHRSTQLKRQIHRAEYEWRVRNVDSEPRYELMGFLIAQADRTTALHREVYETFEDAGLITILDEFGSRLAHLPAELTIPAYDLEFSSKEELTTTLESTREEPWTARKHRASLDAAEETRTRLIAETAKERDQNNETKLEKSDDSTPFSRWFGPSLRVLAGTGLATANAALGVTGGLTATIATIGAAAVPTYVGVATSMYTGLTQVADGLEKIGRHK